MVFEGKGKQLQREHNERAWLAWHSAVLSRVKNIPDLRKLMARDRTARAEQSPDRQWQIFQAMAAAQKS